MTVTSDVASLSGSLSGIPIQKLEEALATAFRPSSRLPMRALADREDPQMLPATSRADMLALRDRSQVAAPKLQRHRRVARHLHEATCTDSHDAIPGEEQALVAYDSDINSVVEANAGNGHVMFALSDAKPSKKKRPLGSGDNLTPFDCAVKIYKIHDLDVDEGIAHISPAHVGGIYLLRLFNCKADTVQSLLDEMFQWKLGQEIIEGPQQQGRVFSVRRNLAVFAVRTVPHKLADVSVKHGLKPTQFELCVLLQQRGWAMRKWDGSGADLKKHTVGPRVRSNQKLFYQIGNFYFLCLLNLQEIGHPLHHGQSESYYSAVFHLAQRSQLTRSLPPNKTAKWYRSSEF